MPLGPPGRVGRPAAPATRRAPRGRTCRPRAATLVHRPLTLPLPLSLTATSLPLTTTTTTPLALALAARPLTTTTTAPIPLPATASGTPLPLSGRGIRALPWLPLGAGLGRGRPGCPPPASLDFVGGHVTAAAAPRGGGRPVAVAVTVTGLLIPGLVPGLISGQLAGLVPGLISRLIPQLVSGLISKLVSGQISGQIPGQVSGLVSGLWSDDDTVAATSHPTVLIIARGPGRAAPAAPSGRAPPRPRVVVGRLNPVRGEPRLSHCRGQRWRGAWAAWVVGGVAVGRRRRRRGSGRVPRDQAGRGAGAGPVLVAIVSPESIEEVGTRAEQQLKGLCQYG